MQNWQRKLQRSVTEMRSFRATRPKESVRTANMHAYSVVSSRHNLNADSDSKRETIPYALLRGRMVDGSMTLSPLSVNIRLYGGTVAQQVH